MNNTHAYMICIYVFAYARGLSNKELERKIRDILAEERKRARRAEYKSDRVSAWIGSEADKGRNSRYRQRLGRPIWPRELPVFNAEAVRFGNEDSSSQDGSLSSKRSVT